MKESPARSSFATIGREQILKIDFGNILPDWEKDFSDAKEISTEAIILLYSVLKHYPLLTEKYFYLIISLRQWCHI